MRFIRNVAIVATLFFGALLVVYNFDWQLAMVAFIVGGVIVGIAIIQAVGYRPPA
jgi:hypothetical protein